MHRINKVITLFFIIIPSFCVGYLSRFLNTIDGNISIIALFLMMMLSCSVGINSWNFINKRY